MMSAYFEFFWQRERCRRSVVMTLFGRMQSSLPTWERKSLYWYIKFMPSKKFADDILSAFLYEEARIFIQILLKIPNFSDEQ